MMYVAVDGYLLQSVDGETNYKIVSFKNVRSKMSVAEVEQFEKEELVDIDGYRSQENDLFECTSKRLFEMIPAQERLFYEQMEPRATKAVTTRTSANCKRSSTSKHVIAITYKGNVKKFLCYSRTGFDQFTFEMPTDLSYGTRERTNEVCYQLYDIEGLEFTDADCDIFMEYSLHKGHYQSMCVGLFERCYQVSSVCGDRSLMKRTFDCRFGKKSAIKKLQKETRVLYGGRIAPLVFMLLNVNRLSIFSHYKTPRNDGGFTKIDSDQLLSAISEKTKEDIDVKCWSQLCKDMLTGKDTLGSVLQVLVRCCAMNFDNIKLKEEREAKTAQQIRKTMDSFKSFLTFASMCTMVGEELAFIDDDEGCSNWKWIQGLYHETLLEEENIERYAIALVPECQGAMVLGKLFNRQYVQDFHRDCRARVAELIERLEEDFYTPSVSYVASRLLRNREIPFREPFRTNGKHKMNESLLNLIPQTYREELVPKFRNEATESMEKTVTLIVDEIAVLVMWMVHFGVGHPYRFPELQQIAYSGPQRNVFVDDKTRRLQLYCTYNKNKSSLGILKTMDCVTSDYLFYFIVVLRQMQINVLRNGYRTLRVTMDPQSAKLMEHLSPAEHTRSALLTYVFLDSNRGDLINFSAFTRYLKQFPKGERDRLTFQELRQGLIALIREYANVSIPETVELLVSITHELMANHSLATALSMYGVDTFSLRSVCGSKAIQLQEEASRRWIAWLGLENGALAQEAMAAQRFVVKQVRHREYGSEPKSLEDLTDAGQKLFGSNFEFRSRSQEKLCSEIYLSGRPSIAVQAPGRPVSFLPLVALASKKSRKNVSFVFVPYTVLLEGTLLRMSAENLLKVSQVKQFIDVGYDGVTDVYVGVFDDLANEDFAGRIVGWESSNGKNANLCYLVVDEFHNLETETYRRKTFDRICKVQFDAFEKVLFLSATAPAAIADGALRQAGFKGLEKPEPGLKATGEDSSGGMTCYPTKMVERSPLAHVLESG